MSNKFKPQELRAISPNIRPGNPVIRRVDKEASRANAIAARRAELHKAPSINKAKEK